MSKVWDEIVTEVERLKSEISEPGYATIWYRGHSKVDWKCSSTLHRHVDDFMARCELSGDKSWKIGLFRTVNHTLYHKFVIRASHLLEPIERSKWGVIFAMRHHGFLTRLLDWTESFACALHFAQCDTQMKEDAAIYLLNPQFLNHITCGRKGLVALHQADSGPTNLDPDLWHPAYDSQATLETIAVAPVFTNRRMIAQKCAFTISGDSFQSLEDRFPTCVRKLIVPADARDEGRIFLDLAGASQFAYFPDLEGLRLEFSDMLEKEVQDLRKLKSQSTSAPE